MAGALERPEGLIEPRMSMSSFSPDGSVIRPAAPSAPVRRTRPTWLLWLIAIILLLAVLNLILVGLRGLYQTPTSASGGLLYVTRFADPAALEWYQYSGTQIVQIVDNSLKFTANDPGATLFSPLQYAFRDFDARVNVRQLQQSADDPYSEYGLLFRYQNPQNYAMFKVRGDGAYHIEQAINGQTVDLSAPHQAQSFALGASGVNRLRVVAVGDRFQFYLNGQLLTLCPKGKDKFSTWSGDKCLSNGGQASTTLIDSTVGQGQIALGILDDQSPIQVAFTDLAILSP